MLHKAIIAGLTIDPESNTPIIILKTEETDQAIPIWIGLLEATSIASALKNVKFDRPMTHDLFKNFTDILNINVVKIEISDIRDNTYYAQIYFSDENESFSVDARPSDAIALALRYQAPIYVDDRVLDKTDATGKDVEVADTSEEGQKWAEYLETLTSDDFGKYKV